MATQYVTNLYPSSTTGGTPVDYVAGNYIKTLRIYSGNSSVYSGFDFTGMEIVFDTNYILNIGTTGSASLVGELDLSSDTVLYIYIKYINSQDYASGTGVGDICFVTLRGNVLASTSSNPTTGNISGWILVKPSGQSVPAARMVLTGLCGSAGGLVDQIGFYYEEDVLLSKAAQNFSYVDPTTGQSTLTYTSPEVINISSQTVTNLTSVAQTASINFSESVSTAATWTLGTGVTQSAGSEVDAEVKIPFVGDSGSDILMSSSMSLSFNWGKTTTIKTDQFSYQADVTVNPGKSVTATATAASATITGTFTATLLQNWQHAGAISQQISGTINSVGADGVVVKYTEADATDGQ